MTIKLNYNGNEFTASTLIWDRDSYFIDFNNYWARLTAIVAQKTAEHTTNNWNEFNLVRNTIIKALGINPENITADYSGPIRVLSVDFFPSLISSNLKNVPLNKSLDELNLLIQDILVKSLKECQSYIKNSILPCNIDLLTKTTGFTKHILITNDSKENNDLFLRESNLSKYFSEIINNINKEHISRIKEQDTLFITKNDFLKNLYTKRGMDNILLLEDQPQVQFNEIPVNNQITINIDGASRGNPGPASIGIVFYKKNETVKEISEPIGNHTNNFAEYTALIKALEISLENNYQNIEVRSDSELVVNQINKKYKVKDADIKELFDKANSLIQKLSIFKIVFIPREENLKADKLANKAFNTL